MAIPGRCLRDGAGSGPWNMAVDEALLDAAAAGRLTLRFYRWDGPWLSLGYAQPLEAERLEACRAAGVGVVRRASGGRAVLHGGDLTYALAAPAARLPAGLEASHGLIADALAAAFRCLGVETDRTRGGPGRGARFDCFAAPAADGLWVGGRKLAGSAQRRRDGALLQHGSLRLRPDPPEAARAAGLWPVRATSLAELGIPPGPQDLETAVESALGVALGVAWEPTALGPEELRQARSYLPDGPPEAGNLRSAAKLRLSSAPSAGR